MAPAASATNKPTLQANDDDDVCQSPSSEMMMATSPTSASTSAAASHSQLPKQDTAFLSPPTSPGLLLDDANESQDADDQHPRPGPSSQPFIFPGGPKASKQQQQQRSTRPGMSSSSSAQQHRQPMLRSASEDVGRSSGTGSSYSQRSTSYAGGTASNPHSRQASREYKETLDARTKDEKDGTRIINQYHLTRVIGQGAYGVVYQGCLRDDPSQVFAVKEFSKTRLNKSRRYDRMRRPPPRKQGTRANGSNSGSGGDTHGQGPGGADSPQQHHQPNTPRDPLEPIRREIAIMKKLDHPNVISLIEALDDPRRDELYLVVEYCSDGPIINVKLHEQTTPLPEEKAQDYFVQMLLGLEFLHHNDIIHRDIKPDNVLLCEGGKTCKIVDFGVSEMFSPNDGVEARGSEDASQRPKGQGTPAFLSPELCSVNSGSSGGGGGSSSKQQQQADGQTTSTKGSSSYDDDGHGDASNNPSPRELNGRRDDVWALGVTLYCMLVGHLPFDKDNFMDLYEAIRTQDPEYPSHLSRSARDLLESLLEKDPNKRITTIEAAREHPWVTVEGQQPLVPAARNLEQVVVEVTEEEIKGAICRITSIFTIARAVTKFKRARSRSSMNTSSPSASPKPQQSEGGAGFASTIASMVSSPQSSFSLSSPTTGTTGSTSTSHAQTVGSPVQHHRQSRQLLQSHQQRRGSGADGEGGSGSGSGGPLGMLTSALGALSTTTAAAAGGGEEQDQEQQAAGEKRGVASPPPTLTEEPEDEVESERRSSRSRSRSRSSVEPQQGAKDDHDAPAQDDGDEQAPSSSGAEPSSSRQGQEQDQDQEQDHQPEQEHEHSLSSLLSDLEARLERKMRRAWPSRAERFFAYHRDSSRERESGGRGRGQGQGREGARVGGEAEDEAARERERSRAADGDDGREGDDKGQAGNAQGENPTTSSSSPSSFFQEAASRLPAWLTGAPQPGEASSGVRRTSSDEEDDENGQQLKVRLFAAEGQPVVKSPGPAPTEVVEDMRRELGD